MALVDEPLAGLLRVDQTLVEQEHSTLVPVIRILFIDIETVHLAELSLVEDVELEKRRSAIRECLSEVKESLLTS